LLVKPLPTFCLDRLEAKHPGRLRERSVLATAHQRYPVWLRVVACGCNWRLGSGCNGPLGGGHPDV